MTTATRTPTLTLAPAPQEPPTAPRRTDLPMANANINDVELTVKPNGELEVYSTRSRDSHLLHFSPEEAYALYLFFAKYPHVAPVMERFEAQRQLDLFHSLCKDFDYAERYGVTPQDWLPAAR